MTFNKTLADRIIAMTGGFIGIALTLWICGLGLQGSALLVASMGASAVLLFAVPHGPLSQPWPLLGGHAISALLGVAVAKSVPNALIAAPLAVALSIGAMHYLRCLHPPGGATALTAVIGGEQVHELGYGFVLTPVLLNALLMLLAAVAVNYAFTWRRYPLLHPVEKPVPDRLNTADFKYALSEMGSFVDISEQELGQLYRLAAKHAWQLSDTAGQITAGMYYCKQGDQLSVRKVLSVEEGKVSYKIVAGSGAVMSAPLADFSDWHEVIWKEGAWRKIRAYSD